MHIGTAKFAGYCASCEAKRESEQERARETKRKGLRASGGENGRSKARDPKGERLRE